MPGRPSRPKDRMQRTKLEIPFGHAFDRLEVCRPKALCAPAYRPSPISRKGYAARDVPRLRASSDEHGRSTSDADVQDAMRIRAHLDLAMATALTFGSGMINNGECLVMQHSVRVRAVSDEATVFLVDDDRDFRDSMAALLSSVNLSSLSV